MVDSAYSIGAVDQHRAMHMCSTAGLQLDMCLHIYRETGNRQASEHSYLRSYYHELESIMLFLLTLNPVDMASVCSSSFSGLALLPGASRGIPAEMFVAAPV